MPTERVMNPIAEQIWVDSQDYVAIAREHLNPVHLRTVEILTPQDKDEWLRIAFLFPTLPDKGKIDLLTVRRFFLIAREHQELERSDPHETAEYSEAMADQVATQLKEALPSFTRHQREILQTHYLILEEQ